MSVVGLIALGVMVLVALLFVTRPLLRRTSVDSNAFIDKQRERAFAYYERVVTNIRDLDEDHATDKINLEEYQQERELWVERGVRILKLFDELDAQHDIVANPQADDAEIDALIEAQIQAMRQTESE